MANRYCIYVQDRDKLDRKLLVTLDNQEVRSIAVINMLKAVMELTPEGVDFSKLTLEEVKNLISSNNIPKSDSITSVTNDSSTSQIVIKDTDDFNGILANDFEGIYRELLIRKNELQKRKSDINDSVLNERINGKEESYFIPNDNRELSELFRKSLFLQQKAIKVQGCKKEIALLSSTLKNRIEWLTRYLVLFRYETDFNFIIAEFKEYKNLELSKLKNMDEVAEYHNLVNALIRVNSVNNKTKMDNKDKAINKEMIKELLKQRDNINEELSYIETAIVFYSTLEDYLKNNLVVEDDAV